MSHLAEESDDVCLVEGIGGWLVPLNDRETTADWVQALDIPVILVVGILWELKPRFTHVWKSWCA